MGIPLIEGRDLDNRDDQNSQLVLLVNETMARNYWPSGSAVGKRIKFGEQEDDVPWITIVGVVADVRQMGIALPVKAEMFFLTGKHEFPFFNRAI